MLPTGTERAPMVVAIALSLSPNQIVDTFEGPEMINAHPIAAILWPSIIQAKPPSSALFIPILTQAPTA